MALGTRVGKPAIRLEISAKTGEMTRWVRTGEGPGEGHEEKVAYVTGRVTDVGVAERKWNDQSIYTLQIRMEDASTSERYVVEVGATSFLATRMVGQLNNADLSQEIYLRPYIIKAGETLNGSDRPLERDLVFCSIKPVLGSDGDKLDLGDGIKPYYGEKYGDKMPQPEPVIDRNGKPVLNSQKQPMFNHEEREALTAQLVSELSARLKGAAPSQADADDDGVSPSEAAAAANSAQMRARA